MRDGDRNRPTGHANRPIGARTDGRNPVGRRPNERDDDLQPEKRDVYCSSAYNETQARREFIDPLFKALG